MRFKNIIKPVAFLGIFVLILAVVSLLFTPKATDKGIEKEDANTIDYLVLGDSESYASIAPMEVWNEYGFTGYNLGVAAQRLQDTYYLLQRSLENQSPKVIMLETNLLHRSMKLHEEVGKVLNSIVKDKLAVYRHHDDWKKLNSWDIKSEKKNKRKLEENIFKGFHYGDGVRPYSKGNYVKENNNVEEIKTVPMYYLNKIVELCKEKNIKLILYTSPSPVCWKYENHNAIKTFAKENELPFIDLNLKLSDLDIDWSKDTYDSGDHVNFSGAKKVTKYMSKYLSENTDLIDHRNDEKYDSWNKTWEEYLKLINEKKSK